jgi:hypothetical protein
MDAVRRAVRKGMGLAALVEQDAQSVEAYICGFALIDVYPQRGVCSCLDRLHES